MLDHLLKKNDLISEFERYGLKEQDIVFIKEMIIGSPLCDRKVCLHVTNSHSTISHILQCDKKQESDDKEELQGSWRYEGRTEEKSFLYEVKQTWCSYLHVWLMVVMDTDCYQQDKRCGCRQVGLFCS